MDWFLLRAVIAVAGTLAAAVQDAKTSFIDDKLLYAMIACGVILDLLSFDVALIQAAFIGTLVIAVIGYLSWRSGQFGSGDVFLLLGLHLLFPVSASLVPWPVVSIFVAASFFAVVGSALWYGLRLIQVKAKIEGKLLALFFGSLILVAVGIALLPLSLTQRVFFLVIAASTLFTLLFMRCVMDFVVVKKITLAEVEDEDILALDKIPGRVSKKYSLNDRLLTKELVKKLEGIGKNEKIRYWPVCKELPRFGPYILMGLAAFLLVGDLLVYVFFTS